jgi:hypothetical protein
VRNMPQVEWSTTSAVQGNWLKKLLFLVCHHEHHLLARGIFSRSLRKDNPIALHVPLQTRTDPSLRS